jgi:CheY-like chemotaxis protein
MAKSKILLVDDDEDELFLTKKSLENTCEVTTATTVIGALRLIAEQSFDVLITDLHMPEPGDGFAVVTAMRHTQPDTLTLVVSDFPDVKKAMDAVLLQADEILVKPFLAGQLADLIDKKMATGKLPESKSKEGAAAILDRDANVLIERWSARLERVAQLADIPATVSERTEHLPEIIRSITARLRVSRVIDAIDTPCAAAVAHGKLRYRQGYSAPLIVQESRILQVCIFETIERNLASVDFTSVLPDIMIIADEVDSQLKQPIESFLITQREQTLLASTPLAALSAAT